MASKVLSRAAKTAVFVSLYLSAKRLRNYFILETLIAYLSSTARCSIILIPSMNTSMLGSSSMCTTMLNIYE